MKRSPSELIRGGSNYFVCKKRRKVYLIGYQNKQKQVTENVLFILQEQALICFWVIIIKKFFNCILDSSPF